MAIRSVTVECDVYCDWQGPSPTYRAYLDNELFTERTWIWPDQYLEETWQITSVPGQYQLNYQLLGHGRLTVNNWRVLQGSASITKHGVLTIHNDQHK